MIEVIEDTLVDSLKLIPFLFLAYLLMEYLEHKTSGKVRNIVEKSGKLGPLFGGILGVVPQCGFSATAANLYSGRIITMGTLIAVFLSTSDEMLPILISEAAPIGLILKILAIKLVIGIVVGFIIDGISKLKNKEKKNETVEETVGNMCDHEHCDCEHGIVKSAIKHTIHIFLFILVISFVINTIVYFIGEEQIASIVVNMPVLGVMLSALVGIIPNCASSVILTQLYLQNIISLGSMIAGLLIGSGVGMLVLFKSNKHIKENLTILGILYVVSVISGVMIDLIL